jgi:hypothetical protein
MQRLELERYHFEVELYGTTFYYEIRFKLAGIPYVDSGVKDTPEQCEEAARQFLADKMRDAVVAE